MTQNDPKSNGRVASVLRRLSLACLAGGGLFLFTAPNAATPAAAEGWQVTSQYYGSGYYGGGFGSWTQTYRRIGSGTGAIHDLKDGAAPGNRCAVPAFEVLNPAPGEARCVGAIYAWQ